MKSEFYEDDYQLVGSFLDQLARYFKYAFKENLNTIMWEDAIYCFYTHKKSRFHIVFKCDNRATEYFEFIRKSLDIIAKKILDQFLYKYEEKISQFDGNITRFREFSKDIDQVFRTTEIN